MAPVIAPILFAKSDRDLVLLPQMANRHGLIAGATGTGKTVTLQRIVEGLSSCGVATFVADVKGDLSGLGAPGTPRAPIDARREQLGIDIGRFEAFPITLWDIFGEKGIPMRATVSEMGPLLLSRLLGLNDTQTGVLSMAFRIADDQGLLLLDLADLRSMLQYVGENAREFTTSYGTIATASVGAIQRALLALEDQGGHHLFGEPALAIDDLLKPADDGRGRVNILAADRLFGSPTLYATFLLWLLSEIFEALPEIGDVPAPKLVFFFDEAHLLFDDAPDALRDKIETVVRLIRSKGVGVFFVTQNPLDIPDEILGQLGNRVQHALRAYTPRDQKAVKAAATTFRTNPALDVETAIVELGVGEALVSCLDEKGIPTIVERALVIPPLSRIGPLTAEERATIVSASEYHGRYDQEIDRESAHEMLRARADRDADGVPDADERKREEKEQAQAEKERAQAEKERARTQAAAAKELEARERAEVKLEAAARKEEEARLRREQRELERASARERKALDGFVSGATRAIGSTLGRQIVRGILGSILGGRR